MFVFPVPGELSPKQNSAPLPDMSGSLPCFPVGGLSFFSLFFFLLCLRYKPLLISGSLCCLIQFGIGFLHHFFCFHPRFRDFFRFFCGSFKGCLDFFKQVTVFPDL